MIQKVIWLIVAIALAAFAVAAITAAFALMAVIVPIALFGLLIALIYALLTNKQF